MCPPGTIGYQKDVNLKICISSTECNAIEYYEEQEGEDEKLTMIVSLNETTCVKQYYCTENGGVVENGQCVCKLNVTLYPDYEHPYYLPYEI